MNKTQGTDVVFWARKKRERRRTSLPQKISLTGADGKRSFPQSSFAFFSFKKRKWERRRTSLPRKFSLRAQRGNEVSHKVLLLSFLSRKESGSDAERHSHKKSSLRAQKGNEVSRKVLCQAFFQESLGVFCSNPRRSRRFWGIIARKKDTRGRAASSTLPRI